MTLSPTEIEKLVSQAESLMESGLDENIPAKEMKIRIRQAIACLDTIIRNAPSEMRSDFALRHAAMMFQMISWDGGIPWRWLIPCDSSTAILSDDEIQKLTVKANTLLENARIKEALCYFDTIVKYSPETAYLFSRRGYCRLKISDFSGAIEDYTQAINLDPHRPELYITRANCKLASSRFEMVKGELTAASLADYESAIQKDPTIADVWIGVICLHFLLNDWDQVISLCGQSQPFVTDCEDKALRAWVLCLAVLLAGDSIAEEDSRPLLESKSIDSLFIEFIIEHLVESSRGGLISERNHKEILEITKLFLARMSDQILSSKFAQILGLN